MNPIFYENSNAHEMSPSEIREFEIILARIIDDRMPTYIKVIDILLLFQDRLSYFEEFPDSYDIEKKLAELEKENTDLEMEASDWEDHYIESEKKNKALEKILRDQKAELRRLNKLLRSFTD